MASVLISIDTDDVLYFGCFRCGNVAAILELDEHLKREFTIFEAAPQVGLFDMTFKASFFNCYELL